MQFNESTYILSIELSIFYLQIVNFGFAGAWLLIPGYLFPLRTQEGVAILDTKKHCENTNSIQVFSYFRIYLPVDYIFFVNNI